MDDLHKYSLNAIYQMIKNGTISIEDLAEYITEVVPELEVTDDLRIFLEAADQYIDRKIESGEIGEPEKAPEYQAGEIVEEVPYVIGQVEGSEPKPASADIVDETIPIIAPVVEEAEPAIEEAAPPDEAPVSDPVPVEDPEPVMMGDDNDVVVGTLADEEYPFLENDKDPRSEAMYSMETLYKYCTICGMTISEISLNEVNGKGPHISFEINNESRQYINHLMNEFYQNSDGISLEMMRDMSKNEFFTLEINPENMSREEFYAKVKETFDRVYSTIETTRKDFEYENAMPDGLRQLKEHFRNDDPEIGQDFTVGYVRNDGKDSYYIVADDYTKAAEYAESIGYSIKKSEGSVVYEVETKGSAVDTKLERASQDLSHDEQVRDIATNGVSDVDIYGSLDQDPKVETIENFIETSNDPHIMCILDVQIPPENENQRIVSMKSEMGENQVVVFTDGDNFDKKVLPRVIDTYTDNNAVSMENVTTGPGSKPDTAYCQIESENNTTMVVDGYSEAEVNEMVGQIESKVQEQTNSNEQQMTNGRQKTLGTYPTNNSDKDNAAFVSMPVLFVICILFLLMLSLLIFAN